MWGTSSSDDKLADDLGNAIEGTRIGGCRVSFFTAGNLVPGNRGLLQQYLPLPDLSRCSKFAAYSMPPNQQTSVSVSEMPFVCREQPNSGSAAREQVARRDER
jgi:hypothetical protein